MQEQVANVSGQALIPTLLKQYNVHIFDITPRPASLPISPSLTYHRGSIDPTSPALSKLFAKTRIDGIIHLAAISLEEWCAPRLAECEKINVGGTKSLLDQVVKTTQKRLVKGARPKPWMVMASSMEVYGTLGQMERNPITSIGRTKLAAELLIEQAVEVDPELRAGIIRFDQVYGYHHAAAIDLTFIPSLIGNALTSLPIQYSSGKPASDYLYIDDAVAGVVSAIEAVRQADTGIGALSYDIVSGEMKTQEEVLEIVKRHTSTLSPIRDIQPGPHRPSSPYNPSSKLDWKASFSTDLETGLAKTIADLVIETERYGLQYLTDNCPSSQPKGSTPSTFGHKLHPADERNRDLTKLDGCTVNIGFNHDGMLHHLKCEDGKHCIVDGAKVPSYNWNQTVFVVHKVKEQGKKMDRRVKVQFKEEKGMGWLGFARTGQGVGLELYDKDQLGVQTSFDLEVSCLYTIYVESG
jgi:nucleoside-diphosphate-sugar epimerase